MKVPLITKAKDAMIPRITARPTPSAFPTVAIFRHLGDFWRQAGDHFFAKIASEIWAIFGQLAKIGQF